MMLNSIQKNCPICGSSEVEHFFSMLDMPVYCNLLWSEKQPAIDCPKGDIKLSFCPSCGFIENQAFDETKLSYSQDYENSLHYSSRFQKYADSLAQQLVQNHNLQQKNIIEIGSGKGDFLVSLCQLGDNQGIGFDPTYVARTEHNNMTNKITFIQDFYSEKYQEYGADFICCRHTLEHIPNPNDLLNSLRKAIGDRYDTKVFFEVPNSSYILKNLAVWDIIYEHCCYFINNSLIQAFLNNNFLVTDVYETFEEQFLCLEAVPATTTATKKSQIISDVENIRDEVVKFNQLFNNLINQWQQKFDEFTNKNKKIVVWGAGSKGVTFLNLLKEYNDIKYVVDLNPRKQGMYIAGAGQKIVSPEFLKDYQPEIIIIMNPIYEQEIKQLTNNLGLKPEFILV